MLYIDAILVFLFGSYSRLATTPMDGVVLENSIFLYLFLWPLPLCLFVIFPELFLPEIVFAPTTFCFNRGLLFKCFLFNFTRCRCDGVVGFENINSIGSSLFMKYNSIEKSSLFSVSNIRLKKKSEYFKKLSCYISELDYLLVEKQKFKRLNFFSKKIKFLLKKGTLVSYSVRFSFSALNTFLHVTDSLGNLKFSASAGSLGFKGKAKKNRFQVLKLFFKKLRELRLNFLKTHPIALHFNNVSSYRRLIIKALKKTLFVKVVGNYQTYSYNGCRKKKKLRK